MGCAPGAVTLTAAPGLLIRSLTERQLGRAYRALRCEIAPGSWVEPGLGMECAWTALGKSQGLKVEHTHGVRNHRFNQATADLKHPDRTSKLALTVRYGCRLVVCDV